MIIQKFPFKDGTFCGKPWKKVLLDLGIRESDLWNSVGVQVNCLWNAKLFPILSYLEMLHLASWLMGLSDQNSRTLLPLWEKFTRVSLEELHRSIDFPKMCNAGSSNHQADLAAGIAKACINYGMLGPEFISTMPRNFYRRRLLESKYNIKVWAAVADETASAVRYGFKERILESPSSTPTSADQNNHFDGYVDQPFCPRMGTSSILAAAVVKGLLQITDGDESDENVARLVLVLEQLMGTGGGWQDQIGGLYPGIKFTTSFPGVPLRLQVIPLLASPQLILELQQRLLVVFTGQVRLAHQVLTEGGN
ncbi:L-FUCOSE KINASE [Salix viminalis]|uniref:L-FUCOSE KINASE n=1 Tax=Salix viminalis TaxID=40686 RepID=A0A9Q0NSL8_SALVM|nr:L-FUCOSE KINASE [Salix viminalis]